MELVHVTNNTRQSLLSIGEFMLGAGVHMSALLSGSLTTESEMSNVSIRTLHSHTDES